MVPSVLGSLASHSGIHFRGGPCVDPLLEVLQPCAGPPAVQGGENEQDTVGEGVGQLVGVFGQEGCFGNGEVRLKLSRLSVYIYRYQVR